MKIINYLLSLFSSDSTPTPEVINSQSAYALYAIDRKSNLADVYTKLYKRVQHIIENSAKNKSLEAYIQFEPWVNDSFREQLVSDLTAEGFSVLYQSECSMIVSWQIK